MLTIKRRKDNHDNLTSEQWYKQNQEPPIPEKFPLSSKLEPESLMRIVCQRSAVGPSYTRRRYNSETGDKEARHHQDNEDDVDRHGDSKSASVEVDAEADE